MIAMSDSRKIGLMLTGAGCMFTLLGVLLLFDSLLLTMGNILFIAGVALTIGPHKAVSFFIRKDKMKGSITFFLGITLVLFGWAIVGLAVQAFGFINLFGDFFPVALRFARAMPVIGAVLRVPPIAKLADRIAGTRSAV
eukprot:TRINITY_DN20435_c0_g1_i3.p1 TRINITY_DN20435_c0_g1~~TRINITY_DN20435_c0_g1_i3.p1  ORF type:complete len:139 (+),score=18.50 TRINITY_DN20435_c0_g1_i3:55-471(+)